MSHFKEDKPVQHPPQVAVSLKPAYRAEHDRIQKLGIMKEVREYINWVNSIVSCEEMRLFSEVMLVSKESQQEHQVKPVLQQDN